MKIGISKESYYPYGETKFPTMYKLKKDIIVYLTDSYSDEQILTIEGKDNGQFELTIYDPDGHPCTITLGEAI